MIEKCKESDRPHDDAIAAGFILGGLSEKFESFKEAFHGTTCDEHAQLIQVHFAAAAVNFTKLIEEKK